MTSRFSLHDDEDDDLRNQQWSTLNDIERQTVSNDIYVDALKCWRRCASLLQPTRRRSTAVSRRRRESLHVTVVGVGGVGSHAALLLARAGVARLRLIDFDQVTLSSLNRHAVADRNDVGVPKVAALRRHIARSCGTTCDVECRVALFNASAADELLRVGNGSRWTDIVVDCIDNVDTKADLVDFCVQRNIRVVVCTGSGARLDAAPMRVADLLETNTDPLVRAIRRILRKRQIARATTACILSAELPQKILQPIDDNVHAPGELSVLPNFRVRIMPVYAPLPCAFGALLAQYTLLLADNDGSAANDRCFDALPYQLSSSKLTAIRSKLIQYEKAALNRSTALTIRDIVASIENVWSCRHSFRPNDAFAALQLVRWRSKRELDRDNMVLLTASECDAHMALLHQCSSSGDDDDDAETARLVQQYSVALVANVDETLRRTRATMIDAQIAVL